MMTKILKLFICCAISFAFSQDNTLLNIKIEGMHCAGGCAKMIEHSLNQNDGISASVDFQNSAATIIYDSESYSEVKILQMINGYRDGKFTASLPGTKSKECSKGKACCQKTGKVNASCDNKSQGCCSSSIKGVSKKKKKKSKDNNSLTGMIPGHTGCTKSCCSSK